MAVVVLETPTLFLVVSFGALILVLKLKAIKVVEESSIIERSATLKVFFYIDICIGADVTRTQRCHSSVPRRTERKKEKASVVYDRQNKG